MGSHGPLMPDYFGVRIQSHPTIDMLIYNKVYIYIYKLIK